MKTFLNLTNGLLYEGPFDGFMRIQSCHCENKKWERVLLETDNNFLMWLAMGESINIVDYSAHKEVPRALYQGLEWIWFACQKAWLLSIEDCNPSMKSYFEKCWREIPDSTRRKLKYFRKFIHNPRKPNIISGRTDKDGDYNYFIDLVEKRFIKTKGQCVSVERDAQLCDV